MKRSTRVWFITNICRAQKEYLVLALINLLLKKNMEPILSNIVLALLPTKNLPPN